VVVPHDEDPGSKSGNLMRALSGPSFLALSGQGMLDGLSLFGPLRYGIVVTVAIWVWTAFQGRIGQTLSALCEGPGFREDKKR